MTSEEAASTRGEIHHALTGYDVETLAAWWVDFNRFHWPVDVPLARPPWWEEGGIDLRHVPGFRLIMDELKRQVAPADRSRAWWLQELGRTAEAWEAWWEAEGRSYDSR